MSSRQPPTGGGNLERLNEHEVRQIQELVGVQLGDPQLLQSVFYHPDLATSGRRFSPNMRLELLGDKVLGLCLAELLIDRHGDEHEDHLTPIYDGLASKEKLAQVMEELGLSSFIRMRLPSTANDKLLSDIFEILMAVIYIDQGLPVTQQFVKRVFVARADEAARKDPQAHDPKGQLQAATVKRFGCEPNYVTMYSSSGGPYRVNVKAGSQLLGRGSGPNRKEAEKAAAFDALQRLAKEE